MPTTALDCWDFGTPKVTTMNVRVNLLAIFVLSVCSTCAHAQFDTVINLPENPGSPNPSGFSGNSIGSSSGISSNTQLNVSNGGSIGVGFEAGAEGVPSTILKSTSREGKLVVHLTPSMAARSTSREEALVKPSMLSTAARSTSREGQSELTSTP